MTYFAKKQWRIRHIWSYYELILLIVFHTIFYILVLIFLCVYFYTNIQSWLCINETSTKKQIKNKTYKEQHTVCNITILIQTQKHIYDMYWVIRKLTGLGSIHILIFVSILLQILDRENQNARDANDT